MGEILQVHLDDQGTVRPLLVTAAGITAIFARATPTTPPEDPRAELRVSGTIVCEPADHTTPAFRGWAAGGTDPARITGRPDRLLPLGYGEYLAEGPGVGQWRWPDRAEGVGVMALQSQILIRLSDDTLQALQARADAQRLALDLSLERLVKDAATALPISGRVVVLSGEALEQLERLLGGGSVLHAGDLVAKTARLAGISFGHLRLPFSPGQLEALKEKAARQGISTKELIERTAPRVYEQFFDLVERSR